MSTRKEYLKYLNDQGLSEIDVLPVLHEDFTHNVENFINSKETMHMVAHLIADYANPKSNAQLESFSEILNLIDKNTNFFLENVIVKRLRDDCKSSNINLPDNIYIGVFPTNSFNGHAVKREGGYIALLHTGYIEFVEAIIETVNYEANKEDLAIIVSEWIQEYAQFNKVPSVPDRELVFEAAGRRDSGDKIPKITSTEEFLILHEFGHCALGHLEQQAKISVDVKYDNEFLADLWALHTQILRAKEEYEIERAYLIYGFLAALYIEVLIRNYLVDILNTDYTDTHPIGTDRIWNIKNFLSKFDMDYEYFLATEGLGLNWVDDVSLIIANKKITLDEPSSTEKIKIEKIMNRFISENNVSEFYLNWEKPF